VFFLIVDFHLLWLSAFVNHVDLYIGICVWGGVGVGVCGWMGGWGGWVGGWVGGRPWQIIPA